MSKYDRKYYLRQTQRGWIRKQHLVELKGGACENCGYNKCFRALSFHHRNPKEKHFCLDLRRIGNKSWKVVMEEFNKCDLLCMNCHHEHHDGESNKDYLQYEMKLRGSQEHLCLNCGSVFKIGDYALANGEGKYCSKTCQSYDKRKVIRPSKEELEVMIWEKPTKQIAKDFGLSDKAVEKWCKSYGINKPPRGYWQKMGGSSNGKKPV